MSHEPPKLDPQAACNHVSMRLDDTTWRCHCGLTIDKQPDTASYLAVARQALKEHTR